MCQNCRAQEYAAKLFEIALVKEELLQKAGLLGRSNTGDPWALPYYVGPLTFAAYGQLRDEHLQNKGKSKAVCGATHTLRFPSSSSGNPYAGSDIMPCGTSVWASGGHCCVKKERFSWTELEVKGGDGGGCSHGSDSWLERRRFLAQAERRSHSSDQDAPRYH